MRSYETIAWGKILELSVPFADLGFGAGEKVRFFATVRDARLELMRFPGEGMLELTVPDEHFEAEMWVV